MNIEMIGTNAGLIWNALNENKTLSVKEIKKATKLKEKPLYAALGWLARESKINLEETEEDIIVTLL